MFVDAKDLIGGAVIEADVAIVGGGAAGISLALELARSGVDVCLLESGGTDLEWPVQSLYCGRNTGLPYFALGVCQLRYLGGNTNAWGGWCRPLSPIDFEARPWVEGSGWPFDLNALAPFLAKAHHICQVPCDDYDAGHAIRELRHPWAKVLPLNPALLETTVYRFSPPTRFGQVYRAALRRARNLRCYLHANVVAIHSDPSARRVTGLTAGSVSGCRFEVKAKRYVLAAGGIENSRLLLASNQVSPTGLGNQHDLVGRFFMEHPHTKRRLIVPAGKLPSGIYGEMFRGRSIMARICLSEPVQRRERLLSYSANIHPIYMGQDSRGWLALRTALSSLPGPGKSDPYMRVAPYDRKRLSGRLLFDTVRQLDRALLAGVLRWTQPNRFIRAFVVESKPEQAPNPHSRVTLDESRDAFGVPRVRLHWSMMPIDRRTAVHGEQLIDDEFRRLGIGSLVPLAEAEIENWPRSLEGGWHQLGTTRMHTDPKHGVVDSNGRVHGMSNLFVTGGSVFPTSGTAPPTLTIVALALRLAAHLASQE
jgi:choline dehydrogenase-like flavoprotein